jgi:hypothetical protein
MQNSISTVRWALTLASALLIMVTISLVSIICIGLLFSSDHPHYLKISPTSAEAGILVSRTPGLRNEQDDLKQKFFIDALFREDDKEFSLAFPQPQGVPIKGSNSQLQAQVFRVST